MKKHLLLAVFAVMLSFAWSQGTLSDLKIAFYNSDSLNAGYKYLVEQDAKLMAKQQLFEKEIAASQKDLQVMYEMLLDAEQKMLYTASEMQMKQQDFQQRAQSLENYQQTEGTKLQQEAIEIQTVLQNRITEFGKRFCEKNGIDLLIMHAPGGQFTFITPKLDVTKAFVSFVNAEQAKM